MHLTQAREKGFFLICSMLGRSLAKVAQRGFKCSASLFGQRTIDNRRNSFKGPEEHFNATMTVRQKADGIRKVVRLGSNLYRHKRLLPGSVRKDCKYFMVLAVLLAKDPVASSSPL